MKTKTITYKADTLDEAREIYHNSLERLKKWKESYPQYDFDIYLLMKERRQPVVQIDITKHFNYVPDLQISNPSCEVGHMNVFSLIVPMYQTDNMVGGIMFGMPKNHLSDPQLGNDWIKDANYVPNRDLLYGRAHKENHGGIWKIQYPMEQWSDTLFKHIEDMGSVTLKRIISHAPTVKSEEA